MWENDLAFQTSVLCYAAFLVRIIGSDNVGDKLAKWTAVLSAESYHTCYDGILISFRQISERDNDILEVLLWIGAVLTWLRSLAFVQTRHDPGWFDYVDAIFERSIILREVDVGRDDMRKVFEVRDLFIALSERYAFAAFAQDYLHELC